MLRPSGCPRRKSLRRHGDARHPRGQWRQPSSLNPSFFLSIFFFFFFISPVPICSFPCKSNEICPSALSHAGPTAAGYDGAFGASIRAILVNNRSLSRTLVRLPAASCADVSGCKLTCCAAITVFRDSHGNEKVAEVRFFFPSKNLPATV